MKPIHQRVIRFLLVAGLIVAAFAGGILVTANRQPPSAMELIASGFTDQDQLRYRAALEKLRYELRAAPGSAPFEQAMSEERLRAAIGEENKKARLLKEKCDLEISNEMIEEEYERLKADPGDTRVLAAIVGALDNDPGAVIEFWLRPTLVDRYLRACVATDDRRNAPARARLEELRRSGDFVPELREMSLKSEELDPEDRAALAATEPGGRTETIESPTDFHFFVVVSRTGDTVKTGWVSAPKPGFELWLDQQP